MFCVTKKWVPCEEADAALVVENARLDGLGWAPVVGMAELEKVGRKGAEGGKGSRKGKSGGLGEIVRDGKVRVVCIVMNLITPNAFMKGIVGDVGSLPWVGAWAQVVIVVGEVMTLYSEDQSCMFYLHLLPW